MPTIASGAKVLVSGANGFIAMWVIRALLEAGFSVRGTVRAQEKGVHPKKLFELYRERFEIVLVGDNTKDGAYDEAVKGVNAVMHLASPLPVAGTIVDSKELTDSSVKGTIGILKSILKDGSGIRRVIILSSTTTIADTGKDKIFDEEDWNDQSLAELEAKGAEAGVHVYRTSKVLSERAAWEIYNNQKDKISWDLTVLNPPWVFGPVIHEVPHIDALNMSCRTFHRTVFVAGAYPSEALNTEGSGWVDVRDLAEAHVRALSREEAGGERIIISQGLSIHLGSFVWQDFVDAAHTLIPSSMLSYKLPTGVPGARGNAKPTRFNTAKEARILGMKYRGIEETTRDILEDYQKHGWFGEVDASWA